jgi:hypothetical protein
MHAVGQSEVQLGRLGRQIASVRSLEKTQDCMG